MRLSAIAIISKNRGLGFENHLLFHIPGELPRFKKITMGHPVIMGRKTFESIGRLLPGRTNIIVTRDPGYKVEGAIIVDSLQKAVKIAKDEEESRIKNQELNKKTHDSQFTIHTSYESEIFILGGGQIFAEALPMIDRLYLTIVDTEVPADTFFPVYSEFGKVVSEEKKTDWDYPYTFLTLEK